MVTHLLLLDLRPLHSSKQVGGVFRSTGKINNAAIEAMRQRMGGPMGMAGTPMSAQQVRYNIGRVGKDSGVVASSCGCASAATRAEEEEEIR